jgi:hypothetical protein
MTVEHLLPLVKKLDRAEKLQLMQSLLYELAEEDGVALTDVEHLIISSQTYPIWSPTEAHEAANTLLSILDSVDF